jgi:putative endonuclease
MAKPLFSLYLLRCADGSIYTGISTDVRRRIVEHESGSRGAKYLRGRGPLELLYEQAVGDRSQASWLEYQVKKLSAADKEDAEKLRVRLDEFLQKLPVGQ